MPALSISLVQDPLLRASLRRLYPELPGWARRWMIATPDHPLPLPPHAHHPAWEDRDTAYAALQATCDAVNTADAGAGWHIHRGAEWVIATPKLDWPHRKHHPAAEGKLTGIHTDGGWVVELQFQHAHHTLTVGHLHRPFIDWRIATTAPHGKSLIDEAIAMCVRPNPHVVIAHRAADRGDTITLPDGTNTALTLSQLPPHGGSDRGGHDPGLQAVGRHAMRPLPTQDYEYAPPNDAARAEVAQRLMERWNALRAPSDRHRVAQFWLGHPHPLLAEVGLVALQHGPRRTVGR